MKNNHWFRLLLRAWVALVSLIAFLGGWIILGHSGKPVSADSAGSPGAGSQLAPLPTLAPILRLDGSGGAASMQPLPQQPSFQFIQPRLRTRGS